MEKDQNPFPKIDLFPAVTHLGRIVRRLVSFLPLEAPDCTSDHYQPNRGGGPALDAALYDQVQTHGFLYNGEQLEMDYGTLPE